MSNSKTSGAKSVNKNEVGNELSKTHFLLGTDNRNFNSQYRNDYPQHCVNQQGNNIESNGLRKTHFLLGDFKNPYYTTTMDQNKDMEKGRSYSIATLDQNVKNDLRRSHFIFGNFEPHYGTVSRSEFYNKADLKDNSMTNAKAIEKVLRSHNYILGNDKPDYKSETQAKYVEPQVSRNKSENTKISTQELQKSHYVFGTYPDNPWITSTQLSYYPKDMQLNKFTKDLSKTNFILGEDRPNFKSVHQDTFIPHQINKANEIKELSQDLRNHHFVFGNENATNLSSIQMQDYADPKAAKVNRIDVHTLRASHFQLGDKCQEPISQYETTYGTTMQPRQRTDIISKENSNFKNSLNLKGDGITSYQTESRVNYGYKLNEITTKDIKKMKGVINDIKGHHWALGENLNDFKTTAGATYLYDPKTATNAKGSLDQEVKNDLRATHYKLGYMDNNPLTTHQTTYVPVPVGPKAIHDPKLRQSHIDISHNKRNVFDSKSMYMVDYTKKQVVD